MAIEDFFERFLTPKERARATSELASRGADALPVLEALFSGQAKNERGVPYLSLWMAVDCGLVAAARLGALAKPLEAHLRAALRQGHHYAAPALGALGSLDEESIVALARALDDGKIDMAFESAFALIRCDALQHASVKQIVSKSSGAGKTLERVSKWVAKHQLPNQPT